MNKILPDTSIIPQFKDLIWDDNKVLGMAIFMFFGLLWQLNYLKYTNHFICMTAASTYYFRSNAGYEGSASVGLGFKFAYLNHMGGIAFGAFIIAVI